MTSERWNRLRRLFERAVDLDPAERKRFLDEHCGDDHELRQEVEALLASDADESQWTGDGADEASPPGERPLPRRLDEFLLTEQLGHGARGTVYRARDASTGGEVAIKILSPALAASAHHRERFRREARAVEGLDHSGVVKVHGFREGDGVAYIVMDLVDGPSLAHELLLLRRGSRDSSVLSGSTENHFQAVARLVASVADSLHHAHTRGVIHRDVKPQNILVRPGGTPCLVDFGLARHEAEATMTVSGQIEGTPNYMSPEQVRAHRAGVDHRTDIYSLGVVLYELLCFRRPFDAPTSEQVLDKILRVRPVPVRRLAPNCPRPLATICRHAMERDPSRRYPTAEAMATDLHRFLEGEPILAKEPPLWRRVASFVSEHPRSIAAVAVLSLVTLLSYLWLTEGGRTERDVIYEQLQARLASVAPPAERRPADLDAIGRAEEFLQQVGDDARVREALDALSDRATNDETTLRRQRLVRVELSVAESASPTCRVVAQRLEPPAFEFGEPEVIASAVEKGERLTFELEPAFYVITVTDGEGGFTEMLRSFHEPGSLHELRAWVLKEPRLDKERRRIEGGPCFHDIGGGVGKVRADVADFLIEATCVTNREFLEYARAIDDPSVLPAHWSSLEKHDPERWLDLPVTRIRGNDARLFAEWSGMRLALYPEWLLAARGPENRLYPTGNDPDALAGFNVGRLSYPNSEFSKSDDPPTFDRYARWYLLFMRPVDATPETHLGPNRLYELFGNVEEWTDGPVSNPSDGRPVTAFGLGYIVGVANDEPIALTRARGLDLTKRLPRTYRGYNLGFRCARSLQPLRSP